MTTWGPEAFWNHGLKGRPGLPSRNTGMAGGGSRGLQGRIKRHQEISVLSLQEHHKREAREVSLKEACRSCIQCNALLLGFSWSSEGDPLGGRAESSFLLLLGCKTSWHNVASPLEKFVRKLFIITLKKIIKMYASAVPQEALLWCYVSQPVVPGMWPCFCVTCLMNQMVGVVWLQAGPYLHNCLAGRWQMNSKK